MAICLALAVGQMSYDWTNFETYHYGWTVLPLSIYLFSLRWRDRPTPCPLYASSAPFTPSRHLTIGWITIALLLPFCWLFREANPDSRLLGVAFSGIAVTAALLTVTEQGGRPWAVHFAGPILFFLVGIPWPSLIEKAVTGVLMPANAVITLEVLHWINIPAIRSGHLITLPGGTLGVEEACSGIRSLQSTLMVAFFLGELNQLRRSSRSILLGAGVAFALFTNILRTLGLSTAAARLGLEAAHDWHDTAGLLALAANIASLFTLTAYLTKKQSPSSFIIHPSSFIIPPPPAPSPPPFIIHPSSFIISPALPSASLTLPAPKPPNLRTSENPSSEPPKLRPPAAALSVLLSAILMFPLTAWWYGRNEQPTPVPWHLAPPLEMPAFRRVVVRDETSVILRKPQGWSARWQSPAGKPMHGFFFEWKPGNIAADTSYMHNPGICLHAVGMKMEANLEPISFDIDGSPATAQLIRFNDAGRPLHVLYMLRQNNPVGTASRWAGSLRFSAILEGRRNTGQRLIEVGLWDEPSDETARSTFLALLQKNLRHEAWPGP